LLGHAPQLQLEKKAGPEALIGSARGMRAVLMERYKDDDRLCSLSPDTVEEFKRAGFFQILQPAALGGLELPAATLFQLEIALAEADMSAAWVVANMGVAAFHVALFGPRAQNEVWEQTPDAIISSANMPGGKLVSCSDGTYTLSGKWRFSSGVEYADWVLLGAAAEIEGKPVVGACLVPRKDIRIIPDWDVVGLRGTGSHGIEVKSATLPRYRFLPHQSRFDGSSPGLGVNGAPLYRLPLPQLLFRSISSASIGGLQGMLNCFIETNAGRTSMMAQKIAQDPHIHSLCAEISADLVKLRGGVVHEFEMMMKRGCNGNAEDIELRRRSRLNVTRIPEHCFLLGSKLHRAAGASALYQNSQILHYFNDLLAARQHAACQYEVYARNDGAALFGEKSEDILL